MDKNELIRRSYVKTRDFVVLIQESSLSLSFKERLLKHLYDKKVLDNPTVFSIVLGAGFTSFGTRCKTNEDQREFLKAVNITSDTKQLPQYFREVKNET